MVHTQPSWCRDSSAAASSAVARCQPRRFRAKPTRYSVTLPTLARTMLCTPRLAKSVSTAMWMPTATSVPREKSW